MSGTTAGAWTTTKPYAPTHLVYVGIVLRSHPNQGIIGVKIQNGYEMDELHNVDAQSPSNNDILSYNTSTSLWEHKQIATTLGFTPISLSSLSATSPLSYNNGTGAFSIQVATASQNGYLSSTDFSTFNNKQAALGGTGFVKITGSTISYDNSTYYLASNPSAFITLASLSSGTGISYSNTTGVISSTITQYTDALARAAFSESVVGLDYSSSTGVLSTTTGYAIPTTAKQTEWDTAYTNRITSLTTTGTSGVATLIANTLNIPNYGSALSDYVPYTGATANVNLATRTLTASILTATGVGINIDGDGTGGGALNLKNYNSISSAGTGYTSIFAQASDRVVFNLATASGIKYVAFTFGNLAWNSQRYYGLPNADGTLALTSDIPSLANYVTLDGTQTISGNKTFSGINSFTGYTSFSYASTFMNGTSLNWTAAGSHTAGSLTLSSAHSGSTSSLILSDGDTAKYIYFSFTNTATGTKTYTLPDTTGTLALTSQIPSLTNYVTLDGTQTISGAKTFSETLNILKGTRTLSLGAVGYANHINIDSGVDFSFNYNNANTTGGIGFYAGTTTQKFYVNNLGEITIGSYKATAIADAYISSAATWNAKATDSLVVHLAGDETITGDKKYNVPIYFSDSIVSSHVITGYTGFWAFKSSGTFYIAAGGTTYNNWALPAASGTLALTSDIPSLAGYVTGSGSTNYIPKWSSGSAVGNSAIYDSSGNIGFNTTFNMTSYQTAGLKSIQVNSTILKGATASTENHIAFFTSADSTNPLGLMIGHSTGATTATKFTYIESSEIGLSPNTLRFNQSGGRVLVGNVDDGSTTFQVNGSARALSSIKVANSGAQEALLQATSNYADGYRAVLRLTNTHTGGRDYGIFSTNTSDGVFGTGKLGFYDYTSNSVLGYFDAAHSLNLNYDFTTSGKILISDGGNTTIPCLKIGSATTGISQAVSEQMNFITSSITRLTISSTGVITATNGAYDFPFKVVGQNTGYGASILCDATNGAGGNKHVFMSSGSTNGAIGGGHLALYDATNDRYNIVITNTGKIHIGGYFPTYADPKCQIRTGASYTNTAANQILFIGSSDSTGPLGIVFQHSNVGGRYTTGLVGTRYGVSGNDIEINTEFSGTGGMIVRYQGNVLVGHASENNFGTARSIQINGAGGSLVETRYNGTSGVRFGSGSDHAYMHDPRNAEMRFATSDSTRFYIYGNGNYDFTGSDVSDRRAKTNISPLEISATDKIMSLQAKTYNMKNNLSQIRYGFIAQDVKEIVSDLVIGNENDGYIGMDYNGLLTLAIKTLQEQQKEIQKLKEK